MIELAEPLKDQDCDWWVYDCRPARQLRPGTQPEWAGFAYDLQIALTQAADSGLCEHAFVVQNPLTKTMDSFSVTIGPPAYQMSRGSTRRDVMRFYPGEGGALRSGPLFERRGSALPDSVIIAAQKSFDTDDWSDGETLEYCIFALQMSHVEKRLKKVALRLISRVKPMGKHRLRTGPINVDHVLAKIKAPVQQLLAAMKPQLMAYREQHGLSTKLATIRKVNQSAGDVSQADYVAFLQPKYHARIKAAFANGSADSLESAARWMLVLMAHVCEPHFQQQTKGIRGRHKSAPPKTRNRMANKAYSDHAGKPTPVAQFNVDLCRKSLATPNADGQLAAWADINEKFTVVRVKNTFLDATGYTCMHACTRVGTPRSWSPRPLPAFACAWACTCVRVRACACACACVSLSLSACACVSRQLTPRALFSAQGRDGRDATNSHQCHSVTPRRDVQIPRLRRPRQVRPRFVIVCARCARVTRLAHTLLLAATRPQRTLRGWHCAPLPLLLRHLSATHELICSFLGLAIIPCVLQGPWPSRTRSRPCEKLSSGRTVRA